MPNNQRRINRTPQIFYSLVMAIVLQTLVRTAGALTVPVTDSHLAFSPYNWNINRVRAVANNPGAYLRARFVGSAYAYLNLDLSALPASNEASTMAVQWSVDGAFSVWHPITPSEPNILLASNLTSGVHDIQVWFVASDLHYNRWDRVFNLNTGNAPAQSLVVKGLTLQDGAVLYAPPVTNSKRILFYGDSITEGYFVDNGVSNALHAYPATCAQLLHGDYAQIGNAGQGWTGNNASTTGVPVFSQAWNYLFAQSPRFPLQPGSRAPDYVVVNMGTNDAFDVYPGLGIRPPAVDAQVQINTLAWLNGMRAFLPDSRVFIVVPFGGFYEAAIQQAFQQYKQTHPLDTKVFCIDLGTSARTGISNYTGSRTAQSIDGLHPLAATSMSLGYQLAYAMQTALGAYDFNGDGKSDIIFQNDATNQVAFWCMDGNTAYASAFLSSTPPAGWKVVGSGDFNGDGKPDLVLQNLETRQICVWYLNGTTVTGGSLVNGNLYPNWEVRGLADINGDGKPDLIFQNTQTWQIAVWYLDGVNFTGGNICPTTPYAGYRIVGIADFNIDGHPDFVFQNDTTGDIRLWYLNGCNVLSGGTLSLSAPTGYHIVCVEDLDGDGKPDLVLQNYTGPIFIWKTNGSTCTSQQITNDDPYFGYGFHIVGPR